jgi:hypothetical protein
MTGYLAGAAETGVRLVLREFADPAIREPAQLATLVAAAIVENLGYRQIRNLWLIAASLH